MAPCLGYITFEGVALRGGQEQDIQQVGGSGEDSLRVPMGANPRS